MDHTERARLIAMYREGPAILHAAWEQVPDAARHFRPAPGEWSAHEIIVHCADSETYAATRIRLLVAEPKPLIVGYDQEAWARLFSYEDASVESSFAVIDAIRSHTAAFIEGLDDAEAVEGVEIFHAGTQAKDGKILAIGGRVLNVSAMGRTVSEAQARAYRAVDRIEWPGGFCRRDIGWQAVTREKSSS